MRRIVLIVSGCLVLLLGVAFVLVSNGVDRYRPQIQAQIQKKLGRSVTLGHLSLHVFPLALNVNGLTIQEAPEYQSSRPFVTADQVYISVGLGSLLSGSPSVTSLSLSEPKIELIRNPGGVWNYSTLGNHEATDSANSEFALDQLKVSDGQIGYTDQLAKQTRSVYDHIDIDLQHFAPHKQFDLDLGAHLPGAGRQLLKFSGKVGPLNAQNSATTPISGHVSLQELTLSGINRFAPGAIPAGADGVATGEADLTTAGQTLSGKGDLKLTDAVVHGAKLGFPISARYNVKADRASDVIVLQSTSIGLGQTSFDLSGSINSGSKPPSMNIRVVTHDSSISELGRLAGAFGIASKSSYQMKGNLSADITASGSTSFPTLNGSLNANSIEISGGEIKQPVRVPALAISLSPQVIRSDPFNAQSGSTALQAQIALSNYSTVNKTVDATLRTSNANIAELLDMAKAYGIEASQGVKGSGRLSLNVRVQGLLSNPSALTFAGNADVNGATVESPTLNTPIAIRSANLEFAQNTMSVKNLNASIGTTTVSGNASARNFAEPQIQFALAADKIDTSELQQLTETATPGHSNAGAPTQPSLMEKVSGSGSLAATTIKAENLVLSNFKASCKLDRGVIQLSPVTADLFGGKEAGTITLNTRPAVPVASLNTKLSGVDTNALLSALSTVKDTLFGSLTANANLSFTLASASTDLAKSLNGTLAFDVTNGRLKNVNILNEISKVGKFLRNAPAQATTGTDLKRLSGTLDIKNGVASSSNLTAGLDAGSLSAAGQVNLVDQGLNMHVNAVLAQDTSQSVGGAGIGGYLNTALANKKGELVLPLIVTGTTSHPIFAPDVQALAKMKLSNLLPTAGDPSKLTSGIIGAVSGKQGASGILNQVLGGNAPKTGQKEPKAEEQPKDSINSILQQFGKKKPKQ